MLLEYADEAKLYVPLTRMDLVEKYRGGGEAAPPLDQARRRQLGPPANPASKPKCATWPMSF